MQKLSSWILWASKHCCGSDSCLESQLQYPAGEPENDNKSCRLTCFLKNNHGAMLHHFRRCCLMVKDFGSYGVKLNWSWLLSEANCLLIRVCYDLLRFTPVPWSVSSWFWFTVVTLCYSFRVSSLRLVLRFDACAEGMYRSRNWN